MVMFVVFTASEVVVELYSITLVQLTVIDPSIVSSLNSQTGFLSSSVLFSAGVRQISFCRSATVALSIEGFLQLTSPLFESLIALLLISSTEQPPSVILLTENGSESLEELKHLCSLSSDTGKYSGALLHFLF